MLHIYLVHDLTSADGGCYHINASKRPPHCKRPGALFLTKTGKIRSKRPVKKLSKRMRQAPRYHGEHPPIILGGKHPGTKLASHLSVGDGAVSEASKGVCFT